VADLGGRGAVLQQQRDQDSGISRKCVQGRVLLRSVEKYLALDAIREASDLHPETMAGVLKLDSDRASALREAPPAIARGGTFVELLHCGSESSAAIGANRHARPSRWQSLLRPSARPDYGGFRGGVIF
jgi:hypothetical protein